ncbi:type III-A CRISPR-associated protein Csm2 [Dysgonamonadaceae bacterium]|nr:type III-A CRISPR-associated protein Csm2 [Dysgonamonadaceae bacterium]
MNENDKKNKWDYLAHLAQKEEDEFRKISVYNDLFALDKSTQLDKVFNQLEIFVKKYANSITTSQIRNIYNKIVKIKDTKDLKLMRPNLAYIAARQDNDNAKTFTVFIDHLIQQVNSQDELESFKKVMEAIVAYHKFHAKN